MLQLRVSASEFVVHKVPFTIGKSSEADLRLDGPGIWDLHLCIDLDRETGKFKVSALQQALLLVNGDACQGSFLRNGDRLQIGGCDLWVGLSAASQRGLKLQECGVWGLLILVSCVELLLLVLLG